MVRRLSIQSVLDALDGIAYMVDGAGVIVGVSRRANQHDPDAFETWSDPIVAGHVIYDSISGEQVLEVYRNLHNAVWSGAKPGVAFFYRCDTPGAERMMRMSMRLMQDEQDKVGVLYQSIPVNEVPRVPLPLPLFANQLCLSCRKAETSLPVVVMCAFCQDVSWKQGRSAASEEWIAAAEYYRRGGSSEVVISHGACPPCVERVLNEDGLALPFTERS